MIIIAQKNIFSNCSYCTFIRVEPVRQSLVAVKRKTCTGTQKETWAGRTSEVDPLTGKEFPVHAGTAPWSRFECLARLPLDSVNTGMRKGGK